MMGLTWDDDEILIRCLRKPHISSVLLPGDLGSQIKFAISNLLYICLLVSNSLAIGMLYTLLNGGGCGQMFHSGVTLKVNQYKSRSKVRSFLQSHQRPAKKARIEFTVTHFKSRDSS